LLQDPRVFPMSSVLQAHHSIPVSSRELAYGFPVACADPNSPESDTGQGRGIESKGVSLGELRGLFRRLNSGQANISLSADIQVNDNRCVQ